MQEITRWVWEEKYRLKDVDGQPLDATLQDTWWRVARALAQAEKPELRDEWATKFFHVMDRLEFLPAGRIIAGAGTNRRVTLFNCFVLGQIKDSLSGIMDALKDAAMTMRQGGGIGHDFSTLRPHGAPVLGVGSTSSGPLSFMSQWDAMCRTIMSAGTRRGAMMGTLRCDHPDVEAFIEAKRDATKFRMFNLSVLVTDAFMQAVKHDQPWELKFGDRVYKTLPARQLWDQITRATYDVADPGVIFIDRINATNPLRRLETISATNPCGEQPLPPYGACLLGSVNLTKFINHPFAGAATFYFGKLRDAVAVAVRMLDNVIDVSNFPLEAQRVEAMAKRRIGIGITGLADALAMLNVPYSEGATLAGQIAETVNAAAAEASCELGREKGSFPLFNRQDYPHHSHRRNSHVTSIAPTGTISLLMGNVSSGIEPIFDLTSTRRVLQADGSHKKIEVSDYAYELCLKHAPAFMMPSQGKLFERVVDLTPEHHLAIQAACQPHVDSSISKTINCPENISFDDFKSIYARAYELGCKGCTTYRPNATTGSILSSATMEVKVPPTLGLPTQGGNVVELTPILKRPARLDGTTYKLKPPGAEHAMYVTITHVEDGGRLRPFEMFINTKNLEHSVWTMALTRMVSAIFRKGGDLSFIQGELGAVHDPRGGYWQDQRYVPSIIAGIGDVVAQHLAALAGEVTVTTTQSVGLYCPACQRGKLVMQEGCAKCDSCTFTKC